MNAAVLWTGPAALLALSAYFFATAPEALPDTPDGKIADTAAQIPINQVFGLIAAENDAVRTLYTKSIVGAGKKAGLAFDENWKEKAVQAGPLPALFLRECALDLQRSPIPLGLYLGSDYPLQPSNKFTGKAARYFSEVKSTRGPKFFYSEDIQRHTAMFPDFAIAQPCVSCHNKHPDTPKTDWKLEDVMGATTWTYPKATVSLQEALEILAAARHAFRSSYAKYLKEVATFDAPPAIGTQWPSEGYYLPSTDAFMAKAETLASAATVRGLLALKLNSK